MWQPSWLSELEDSQAVFPADRLLRCPSAGEAACPVPRFQRRWQRVSDRHRMARSNEPVREAVVILERPVSVERRSTKQRLPLMSWVSKKGRVPLPEYTPQARVDRRDQRGRHGPCALVGSVLWSQPMDEAVL